jgi:hypothetical protein
MVMRVVVPPAYQSSNPRVDICVNIFLVGGGVPVDSEAPVVTSSISKFDPPAQFLKVLIGVG